MQIGQHCHTAFPSRIMLTSLFLLLLIVPACGVIGIHEQYGQPFNYDNSLQIRHGMTREEVIGLLGEPYIIGQEQNGDIVLKYEWRETDGNSVVFGLFIMGERRTVAVNGGESTITLASDSRTVKKIEYKIVGHANYERLKGGTKDAIQ